MRVPVEKLSRQGVRVAVGTEFDSDRLERFRAHYVVVEVGDGEAEVLRLFWSDCPRPLEPPD